MLKLGKKVLSSSGKTICSLILFPKIWEVKFYYLHEAIDVHIFCFHFRIVTLHSPNARILETCIIILLLSVVIIWPEAIHNPKIDGDLFSRKDNLYLLKFIYLFKTCFRTLVRLWVCFTDCKISCVYANWYKISAFSVQVLLKCVYN